MRRLMQLGYSTACLVSSIIFLVSCQQTYNNNQVILNKDSLAACYAGTNIPSRLVSQSIDTNI